MSARPHLAPFLSNSAAIRQEIQRFESVHPSIYAIYDLIELVPDALVAQQIRDHVVCIEVCGILHYCKCPVWPLRNFGIAALLQVYKSRVAEPRGKSSPSIQQ